MLVHLGYFEHGRVLWHVSCSHSSESHNLDFCTQFLSEIPRISSIDWYLRQDARERSRHQSDVYVRRHSTLQSWLINLGASRIWLCLSVFASRIQIILPFLQIVILIVEVVSEFLRFLPTKRFPKRRVLLPDVSKFTTSATPGNYCVEGLDVSLAASANNCSVKSLSQVWKLSPSSSCHMKVSYATWRSFHAKFMPHESPLCHIEGTLCHIKVLGLLPCHMKVSFHATWRSFHASYPATWKSFHATLKATLCHMKVPPFWSKRSE